MKLAPALSANQVERDDGSAFSLAYQDVVVDGTAHTVFVQADRFRDEAQWWYGTFCYGFARPFRRVAILDRLVYAVPVQEDDWYIDDDDA